MRSSRRREVKISRDAHIGSERPRREEEDENDEEEKKSFFLLKKSQRIVEMCCLSLLRKTSWCRDTSSSSSSERREPHSCSVKPSLLFRTLSFPSLFLSVAVSVETAARRALQKMPETLPETTQKSFCHAELRCTYTPAHTLAQQHQRSKRAPCERRRRDPIVEKKSSCRRGEILKNAIALRRQTGNPGLQKKEVFSMLLL